MIANLQEKLRKHFGFKKFRRGQARVVAAALEGRDVIVVMPTGSGKSLCFQLPGLELNGTTVVVGPLIALMKDQADRLREQGISATVVNSTLSEAELREAEAAIAAGKTDFVYTTPERMSSPEFRELLRQRPVDLFVVDEAHCVSQWGHDFRPDYLTLAAAIDDLNRPPVLALTATATEEILNDITEQLRIPEAELVHTGFYRRNLKLRVEIAKSESDKNWKLKTSLPPEGAGIVYCATTAAVDKLGELLDGYGQKVSTYHGRMSAKRRHEAQEQFMSGAARVMVATNAFGLGIDKPDIRFVIHYHMPACIEAYYQEVGRAGRDGSPAECLALYDHNDQKLQRFLSAGSYPDDSDLVNAYHAVELATQNSHLVSLEQLLAASPLSKSRMKVCLALFENKGIIRREKLSQYCLVQRDLSRDQLAAMSASYRLRSERQVIRLQQVHEYAEGNGCRWQSLLNYFDDDEALAASCGHCDRC